MSEDTAHKKPYAFDPDIEPGFEDIDAAIDAASETTEVPLATPFEADQVADAADETRADADHGSGSSENRRTASASPKKTRSPSSSAGNGKRRRPASKSMRKKITKKKGHFGRTFLLVLLLLIAVGVYVFFDTYVIIGKELFRRDAMSVDLRQSSISLEKYQELTEKLPNAEILWNVPFGGGEFSCDSENISISQFSESDMEMLSYFSNLKYIDAEFADLTLEQYQSLTAALPGVEIDWSVPLSGGRFPCGSTQIAPSALTETLSRIGDPSELLPITQFGSCVFSFKPGDGSAREQAASCQKVLGGLANICYEFATKRYRSNCINWGILPFTLDPDTVFEAEAGDRIFVPDVRSGILSGSESFPAVLLRRDGTKADLKLYIHGLTADEREILLDGCLINYYAAHLDK